MGRGIAIAAQTTTAINAAKRAETVTALSAVFCVIDAFSQFVRMMTVRYSPIMIPPSSVSLAKMVITAKSRSARDVDVMFDVCIKAFVSDNDLFLVHSLSNSQNVPVLFLLSI
mmetsp:Transcript_25640/g.60090  ORF Transcript_25640/g.60090 Transcript_25640/m.60090 type:complete len:113 (-) Transcript_25640:21-359(-)